MTEDASGEAAAAEQNPTPVNAKDAVSKVSSLAQLALGSFATFSGLLYAMGYLLTLGQMRMLGAGSVDVSNQEIVRKVISIPLLSGICALVALFTVEGFLLGIALLLVCLFAARLGLYRQKNVEKRNARVLIVQWFGPLLAVVVVGGFALGMAWTVLDEHDLLLDSEKLTLLMASETEDLPRLISKYPYNDLVKLKATEGASQQVYGFVVLSLAFCLTVLVGLGITSRYAEATTPFRDRGRKLIFGIAVILVVLQFLNIPFLYGYLVMETEFPTIQTTKFRPAEVAKFQSEDAGTRVVILGSSGGQNVVYSLEHKQMWRGVSAGDLLPAKQIPEQDPLVFGNPFPQPEQIKSISGSLLGCDATATTTTPVPELPEKYWIDLLSALLPATRSDDEANTATDEDGYVAKWEDIGTLKITTHKGQVLDLVLYEVHEGEGDELDFYLAFKMSRTGEQVLALPETTAEEADAEAEGDEPEDKPEDEEGELAAGPDALEVRPAVLEPRPDVLEPRPDALKAETDAPEADAAAPEADAVASETDKEETNGGAEEAPGADEAESAAADDDSEFVGRVYYRCDKEFGQLTRGSYYYGGDPLRLKQLLGLDFSPKPVEEEKPPAEE